MCGIIYVWRKDGKAAHKQVLKRYSKQKARGYEGFGFIALDPSHKVAAYKRTQGETELKKELEAIAHSHVLFHHRYPTSTPNVPASAHPIHVSHKELKYDYYVVHNGVLSNDEDLRDEHLKAGYKYTTDLQTCYEDVSGRKWYGSVSWNDSEALAIELARGIEGIIPEVKARGAAAYIVLQVHKVSKKAIALYYGTNGGNPLTISRDKDTGNICIASQGGQTIPSNVCHKYTFASDSETTIPLTMPAHGTIAYNSYGYNTGYTGGYDTEYPGHGVFRGADFSNNDRIAELNEEYNEILREIQYAKLMNDPEELEELQFRGAQIKAQLKTLEQYAF